MDDEYFGRIPGETEPTELARELGGPEGAEPSPDAIVPDPATAYLTLAAIEQHTGIKYVSLLRYAQQFGDRLPHEGTGRNRRYYPSAIAEFQRIKVEMSERRSGNHISSTESGAPTKQAIRHRSKSRAVKAKGRKGKGTSTGKKMPHGAEGMARAVKKLPQGFRFIPSPAVAAPISLTEQPQPQPDLDRLAKVYQLRLQLKTLDEVAAFVASWCTRIETEIKELEGAASR